MALLIRNAWFPGRGLVDMRIESEQITTIAKGLVPMPQEEILEADGLAVLPGLVNGHTHAAMTLFRGFGDDMPLMEWLQTRIWPAEARLTYDDVYWGTRLACLEMIRSGTLCFQDMYWHYHAVARAVEDSGLRAGVGAIMIDAAGEAQGEMFRQLIEQNLQETGRYSKRVRYTLTPHAIYTVSEKNLRWIAAFSERHQVPVHIHLSETETEVHQCLAAHGMRPAFYLDRLGLLNPKVSLAHGVWLDEDELDRIAQRGATLVTNPTSNLKLAVGGIFPYSKAAARGIPMALGTDGAASNNSLDLFQEVKLLALIQKHADRNPSTLPALDAWDIVTGANAPLLGETGRVEAGGPADFILIRRDAIEMTPEHCLMSNLVYAATGHLVDSVVVAGRLLMRHRHIQGEEEVRQEAAVRAKAVCRMST